MKSTGKGKISYVLQTITTLPLLLFGLIILGVGTHWFTKSMYSEVEIEIITMMSTLITGYMRLHRETDMRKPSFLLCVKYPRYEWNIIRETVGRMGLAR